MKNQPRILQNLACGAGLLAFAITSAHAQTNQWGDNFYLGNSASSLSIGANPISARFTASSGMTLTGATIQLSYVTASSDLQIGIMTDNGSGAASGTFLGSGSVTATGAGYWSVSFDSSVALSAGAVYHLMATNKSAGATAGWRDIGAQVTHQPRDSFSDSNWGTGYAYSPGSFGRDTPVYLLSTTSGPNYGSPYTLNNYRELYQDIIRGEQFVYRGSNDQQLISAALRLYVGAAPPDDLSVALLSLNNTLLASGALSKASSLALGVASNYTVSLVGAPVLTNGVSYRLVAWSSNSTLGNNWQLVLNGTGQGSDYAWNGAGFDGTNSFGIGAFSYNPTSATYGSLGDSYDAFFNLTMVAIPEPATLALTLACGLALVVACRKPRR
jgi:hypothetical protein